MGDLAIVQCWLMQNAMNAIEHFQSRSCRRCLKTCKHHPLTLSCCKMCMHPLMHCLSIVGVTPELSCTSLKLATHQTCTCI